jgi:hypothetical protein
MQSDLRDLDESIREYREDVERVGELPENLRGGGTERRGNTAAPLEFEHDQLRHAHERLAAGEAVRLETRGFTSATPILPAELAPYVTFPVHEGSPTSDDEPPPF